LNLMKYLLLLNLVVVGNYSGWPRCNALLN
jgi:hypothetical protein